MLRGELAIVGVFEELFLLLCWHLAECLDYRPYCFASTFGPFTRVDFFNDAFVQTGLDIRCFHFESSFQSR